MLVILLFLALFACQLSAGVTAYVILRESLIFSRRWPLVRVAQNKGASVRIAVILIGILTVSFLYFWALIDVPKEVRLAVPESARIKQLIGIIALNVCLLPLTLRTLDLWRGKQEKR